MCSYDVLFTYPIDMCLCLCLHCTIINVCIILLFFYLSLFVYVVFKVTYWPNGLGHIAIRNVWNSFENLDGMPP